MAWKKVHPGRWAVMGAALLALVVVAGISVVVLRTRANPVLRTISVGFWDGPLVVDESGGRAFVGITDPGGHSRIEMLDAVTGAVVRTIAIPGWALAVDEQAARLVVSSPEGVRVLDAHNGALVRLVHVSPIPNAAVVDARAGRIYVAGSGATSCTNQTCTTSDGVLAVLDAHTGRLLHTTTLRHQGWTTLALDDHAHHLVVTSGVVGVNGKPGTVSIFDTASGRLLYRTPLTPVVWPSPVVDEVTGRAFLVGNGGRMNAGSLEVLDTHSGGLLRAIPLRTGLAAVALDERMGRVFATDFGPVRIAVLRVLDARSGRLVRTIPIGPTATAVAVDGRRRRLYVTTEGAEDAAGNPVGPGNLTVLDERSGRVLRTVAVGVNPWGLVLDQRAGSLFVVNVGSFGPARTIDPWAWVPHWLRRWLPFLPQHAPAPRRIPGSVMVLNTSRL